MIQLVYPPNSDKNKVSRSFVSMKVMYKPGKYTIVISSLIRFVNGFFNFICTFLTKANKQILRNNSLWVYGEQNQTIHFRASDMQYLPGIDRVWFILD